ncbi:MULTISPECIES: TRAP transporter permease [unclassified Agarivorans]|uniref:TRAP transporter permease n=1 Tax=unclassified Agarivorans TaxID=2636026 RepID=UPI0026E2F5AB|nr:MULTISPECIES: TRAP transporter fused permease subunit [unclassified Agarivorans]MDO6686107.1 TRAP transporter fused permease subunit [Agarivorans sp. 3_MG-2023]MDO6717728.1 TRAP transporter fused permease subunit [Agarivorans sp. 2_MG-2023]
MQWNAVPDSIRQEIEDTRAVPVVYGLGIVISLAHVYFNIFADIAVLQQNILHFAGFVLLCGLLKPLTDNRFVSLLDKVWVLAIALSAVYLLFAEDLIYERGVRLVALDWLCGTVVILGAIDMTRRATGWVIPILIVTAISYLAWWGNFVPGVFQFKGLSLETLLFRSIYGDDAIFGNIARISASFVFMFILFGAFLLRSGAGDFVIHLSKSIASRLVGGPGIVAIIASGLTGTISGSAVANTASTGVVTIPLMKNAGFSPRFAAAVEASASTGGQIVPPIMGAGAFVMASYTQIPYSTIVMVSILPAILYFASLVFYVRTESYKAGLTRTMEKAPPLLPMVMREGLSFIVPVTLLIVLLVMGYTPTYAAVIAIIAVIVSSWFTPNKMGFRAIADAFALGSRNMVVTAVLLCSVGLIVNVIATAGIGNTFSLMITEWSGGSLLIALLLVAIASLVLGMGLPVTASYIVLATLSAPALLQLMANAELVNVLSSGSISAEVQAVLMLVGVSPEQGSLSLAEAQNVIAQMPDEMMALLRPMLLDEATISMLLLASHLVIFWLSQDSNVTPPVCLCTFTAAAIAKSPPMATGFTSWKIAKGLYIIPLLFAYTPLAHGNWLAALQVFGFALPGLYAFTLVMQGWQKRKLQHWERALMACIALVLLCPLALQWQIIALAVLAIAMVYFSRSSQPVVSA